MKKLIICLIAAVAACTKATSTVSPVDIPVTHRDNFNFPESHQAVYTWVAKQDDAAVAKHAWGIWAELTKKTDQSYNGTDLLVFETWHGVGELSDAAARGDRVFGCVTTKDARTPMRTPKQFAHGKLLGDSVVTDYAVLETVAYSPDAACFSTANLLFNQSSLNRFSVAGDVGKIPEFPVRSVTTKPTYYVAKATNGLVRVPAWVSTPVPAKQFGHHAWGTYVYADLSNSQEVGKKPVLSTSETPTAEEIAAATVNVDDFIHFTVDKATADYLNARQDKGNDAAHQFSEGEVALLVAMHVTTKEIKNWTWQTYYWSPTPATPGHPSSDQLASLITDEVQGAARHYAVSPCYDMVSVDKTPMICYNPYLEAGFGPKVFKQENKWRPEFVYGVQTNCMSCHALATASGKLGYTTDQFIDIEGPLFNDEVQLDFAWSIQGNINTDK